jgi:hypothetical protein
MHWRICTALQLKPHPAKHIICDYIFFYAVSPLPAFRLQSLTGFGMCRLSADKPCNCNAAAFYKLQPKKGTGFNAAYVRDFICTHALPCMCTYKGTYFKPGMHKSRRAYYMWQKNPNRVVYRYREQPL